MPFCLRILLMHFQRVEASRAVAHWKDAPASCLVHIFAAGFIRALQQLASARPCQVIHRSGSGWRLPGCLFCIFAAAYRPSGLDCILNPSKKLMSRPFSPQWLRRMFARQPRPVWPSRLQSSEKNMRSVLGSCFFGKTLAGMSVLTDLSHSAWQINADWADE